MTNNKQTYKSRSLAVRRCRNVALFLLLCLLSASCEEPETSSNGNYSGTIVECIGSTAEQELTVALMITNTGFNDEQWVGGASNGTTAVDSKGNTLKPYSNMGHFYEFPTGTAVRVTVERLGKIMPGTLMLQTLKVSIGTENMLEFHDVLIAWD
jgi:hypothetical protein